MLENRRGGGARRRVEAFKEREQGKGWGGGERGGGGIEIRLRKSNQTVRSR